MLQQPIKFQYCRKMYGRVTDDSANLGVGEFYSSYCSELIGPNDIIFERTRANQRYSQWMFHISDMLLYFSTQR